MAGAVAERLYYDSPVLEFAARVTDIRLVSSERNAEGAKEQLWQVALDRTAFYPESGGQPWDTGVLVAVARSGAVLEVPVERVEEDEHGEVWHAVRKPLIEGTEITGRIDTVRRVDHMQQHSGQHLLSAVFLAEIGARTVSFHLGAESSTIDLLLPEGMVRIEEAGLERVEREANRLIFEDRAMTPRWHTREEAEAMLAAGQLRKLPERSGPMRVVEMAGVEFNACGGTHVASTGAIGGLMIRRVEKAKGGWRVEFVCGQRAVAAARREYVLVSGVAASLSVPAADVPARVVALLDEVKAAGKERRALLDELAKLEAARLVAAAAVGSTVQAVFAGREVEFAKRIASDIQAAGHAAVIGVVRNGTGDIVLAKQPGSAIHAGNALREVLAAAGARGGGSADLAQGVCRAEQVPELCRTLTERVAG